MRVFDVIAKAIALVLASTGLACAQTAAYPGGSIYDLAPPTKQATGSTYLEALILSKRLHRMKEMQDYPPNDVFRRLARPVGRLAMAVKLAGGKRGVAYCTVSLIAENLILTNHHCIPGNPNGRVVDALLWMGFLTTRHAKGVKQYGVELEPVEADSKLDYAIHKVRGMPGKTWGTIELSGKPQIYDRQSLFIIHHPAGDKQHITLGDCQAGTPATVKDDLRHICDTIGGSSGAPVFDLGSRKIVGLHYRAVEIGKLNAAKRLDRLLAQSKTLQRLTKRQNPKPPKPIASLSTPTPPQLRTPAKTVPPDTLPDGSASHIEKANPKIGKILFKKCKACHTIERGGSNRIGPNLWGILGSKIASVSGYRYSRALRQRGGSWTYKNLTEFLKSPRKFAKGTRKIIPVRSAADRANLIAYLRQQADR